MLSHFELSHSLDIASADHVNNSVQKPPATHIIHGVLAKITRGDGWDKQCTCCLPFKQSVYLSTYIYSGNIQARRRKCVSFLFSFIHHVPRIFCPKVH